MFLIITVIVFVIIIYNHIIEPSQFIREVQPIFKFLLEWTNISPKLFDIAKEHLALPVPFGFQIEKYYKMILKQKHKRKGLVFRTEEEEEMQRERFFGNKEE